MGQILRLIKIYIVVMRNSLDKDLFDFKYLKFIKIFRIFFPNLWFRNNSLSRGERIKNTFEELGPIFVKLGQTISTRKDLLGDDAEFNAKKMVDIFKGEDGDFSKAVCLNAAAGLIVAEKNPSFNSAYEDARKHILSGKTYKNLKKIQNV